MNLTGLNVSDCPGITLKGLEKLAENTNLTDIAFSSDALTEDETINILSKFRYLDLAEV